MTDCLHDPRRSPRLPVRCTTRLALRSGAFLASCTIDVGAGGCGLETPARLVTGDRAFMDLGDVRVGGPHLLSGRLAWASATPPWRCGIAFDPGSARAAAALFERLARAYPELPGSLAFGKLAADAFLSPDPVPERLARVTPAQEIVLRALGEGTEAGALRDRLGVHWGACASLLFALIARQLVVIGARAAGETVEPSPRMEGLVRSGADG